jgi:hypothetical protein
MNYLKYLVYAMVLYLLFTFIPKNKIILTDLLLIVTILILFNIFYDLLELTFIKINLEGFNPYDKNLFSDIKNYELNPKKLNKNEEIDPNIITNNKSKQDNNTDLEITKITQDNIIKSESNDKEQDNITNLKSNDKEQDNLKSNDKEQDVSALETSTNNFASLVLSEEDTNKKDKINYNPKTNKSVNEFIYGYSFLHTDNWNIPTERKPICKNVKPCKICPRKTYGFKNDLMKWHSTK